MKIALTGASGHMGLSTLLEFLTIPELEYVRVLLLPKEKRNKLVRKIAKKNKDKVQIIYGDISNIEDVKALVKDVDYLFNLAAVIPPKSDKHPELSYLVNEVGAYNIVKVCEENKNIKLIDITSVALYGHRNEKHPFERVGDPLLPSVFDAYAAHKLRGEYAILESNIPNFVIIRQTAMVYLEMLNAYMSDGLMFHTPFNDPLEWSTAEDSGRLMANIVKEDILGHLNHDNFWNKVFNLGDGEANRISGYDTLEGGFKVIGGTTSKFFDPNYNVTRNFHGGFYYDGDDLEKLFHYQNDKIDEYWAKVKQKYSYYSLAKIVPSKIIKKFAIKRLFKDSNSPVYWYKHGDVARLTAFFGGVKEYENLPTKWEDFKLIDLRKIASFDNYISIDFGFDINKSDKDITLKDLQSVASMHGGKLLDSDFKTGDVYKKLHWVNQDGEEFIARPYTILRGGHWMNPLYKDYIWDFDRLSKKDKIFAQYWYDSHSEDENHCYYMDKDYKAYLK